MAVLQAKHSPPRSESQNPHPTKRRLDGAPDVHLLSRVLAWATLADQKMNVFGRHHVADDHPLVTLPNLFHHFHEQVAARGAGQPGLPPVTTECEEVQIVSAVPALQAPRHNRRLKEPLSSRCDLGHIVKVTDHENPQVSKTARPGPPAESAPAGTAAPVPVGSRPPHTRHEKTETDQTLTNFHSFGKPGNVPSAPNF